MVLSYGNPMEDADVKDTFHKLQSEGKQRYGGPVLSPFQFRDLVKMLMEAKDLRSAVILVLATHLYVRCDEILTLSLEDILIGQSYFDRKLQLLPIRILGKHDESFNLLTLRRNTRYPLCCPIEMLE